MILSRLRLEAYRPDHAERWSAFVRTSKNGAVLFERGFMDYHADRFADASLLAFEGEGDDNLVGVLPACRFDEPEGPRLVSHGGLSFGGWITDQRMTAPGMLRIFDLLLEHLSGLGYVRLTYKAAPVCYHRLPSQEDLYALFRHGAGLSRCDLTSVIDLQHAPPWSKGKRHGLAKARTAGLDVSETQDLAGFSTLLADVLARHGASPTHSLPELELLAGRFPETIRLFVATRAGVGLAYALVFDSGQTVHTQYLASGDEGRATGALDAIVDHLQHNAYPDRRYLSFGISTEDGGRRLNEGLVSQKEMFGARSMICPWYDLPISPAASLRPL